MSLLVRDVVTRAAVLLGSLASGAQLGSDDGADALLALNAMKRAMFGTLIGPRLGPITPAGASATTAQAESGGEYMIPGGAAFTLTAPANPRAGARFGVVDANLAFGAYPCTVARNGRLIAGVAASYVIAAAGANTRFWFRGDTANWTVEADYAALTAPTEFPDVLAGYLPYMLAVAMAADFGQDLRSEVIAAAAEGREAFARAYARRGRGQIDPPIGVASGAPVAQPAQAAG